MLTVGIDGLEMYSARSILWKTFPQTLFTDSIHLRWGFDVKRRAAESGLLLLLIITLTLSFNIKPARSDVFSGETIYIRADGSIEPPSAPIQQNGDIYTVTGNITSSSEGIVIEKSNVIVEGAECTLEGSGIYRGFNLTGTYNVSIKNIRVANFGSGIYLESSSNNSISGSDITNNSWGICLYNSSDNIISGNNIENNGGGIELYTSSNNIISGNNIATNTNVGINLVPSSNNSINCNNITDNGAGIILHDSSGNNTIFHNNFINNTNQTLFYSSNATNFWDYGSQGNYWSDYSTKYPNATINGDTWNTPYVINENNTDSYPLTNQITISEFPSILILPLFMLATLAAAIAYKRKRLKFS